MLTSDLPMLVPELMDVVRLFEGAEALDISHSVGYAGGCFVNAVRIGGDLTLQKDRAAWQDELHFKSLVKRYAKLALYRALSAATGVTLPWISAGGSSMMAVWGLLAFIKASDERTYAARRKSA